MKVNPEFLPIIEWWEKDGKQLTIYLAVAAIAVGGWYGWKNHKAAVRIAASDALVSSYTTEELEDSVSKFSGTAAEGALKLRLAKSYLDGERWEEAEKVYGDYVAAAGADDPFVSLAQLGRAYALEGAGKVAEASKEFESLAANTNLPVSATAALGVVRCMALNGDKAGALKKLEASTDPRAKNLSEMIKRYDPNRKSASLFDAADAAATKIAAEKTADAKKAEAKPVEAKPAAVKPAEAKPAAKPAEKK